MTETRKKIIDIIEPWMDKTLSEGCLLNMGNGYINKIISYEEGGKLRVYCYKDKRYIVYKKNEYRWTEDFCNVIGHYDITAVLKYIDLEKGLYIDFRIGLSNHIYIVYSDGGKDVNFVGKILNKPLSLYTEQEEKDLLTLLKEIGIK